ncbi:hypothetical protein PAXRUDRAFT_171236, partial [Paxillus rubicundulus Ve08.2h10]
NHAWWQAQFIDHPGLKSHQTAAYVGNGASTKAKVYCEKCYNTDLISLGLSNQNNIQNNR